MKLDKKKLLKIKALADMIEGGDLSDSNKKKLTTLKKLIAKAENSEQILGIENKLNERLDDRFTGEKDEFKTLIKEFKDSIAKVKSETNDTFGGIRQKTLDTINKLFIRNDVNKKLKEKLKEANTIFARIEDKLSKVRNGKDSDEKRVISAVLAQIEPSKNGEKGEKGDSIKGDRGESFDPIEFDKLREELFATMAEELRKHRQQGGGGTSAIGVKQAMKNIGKTEQPSGTINGANKVFTVSQDIFYVLGFTINNQQIAELPNFTYTGKTITFDLAIPASYSGKDFEIKYF